MLKTKLGEVQTNAGINAEFNGGVETGHRQCNWSVATEVPLCERECMHHTPVCEREHGNQCSDV